MKIAFLTITPLAGMPWRTARVCNQFLENEGGWMRCITARASYGGSRTFPTDLLINTPEAERVLEEADLFIVTAYMPDGGGPFNLGRFPSTPVARHYSTEHERWVDKQPDPINSTVVAQYQHRFATYLAAMPNCIPIDDPMFRPAEKPEDRVVIVYTPTTKRSGGWGSKGYGPTVEVLKRLQNKHKGKVEPVVLMGQPYEDSMRAKRHAHIVIDEVITGSYHSSGLEGMSCGAATFAYIDRATQRALGELLKDQDGAHESMPWQHSTLSKLEDNINALVSNPSMLKGLMGCTRSWIEKNYSEAWQAKKWIEWHRSFLKNSIRI
jgi:hypothetical protein